MRSGESGAEVFRSADGALHRKRVATDRSASLAAERDRLRWLSGTGIPGPDVIDWSEGDGGAELTMTTVPGVPADILIAGQLWDAWTSIAEAVRGLHEVPTATCPFSHDVVDLVEIARAVVRRGAVNPEFLRPEDRMVAPSELLARLELQLEVRMEQQSADAVVCHGDLCLPNLIVDPDAGSLSGFIDVGRLGVGDPHVDLTLLLATARETWSDDVEAARAEAELERHYGPALDHDRMRFYLALDPLTWG
nr:aminoglycoside 3'-phosphotransferase [Nocardioides speluncae]